MRETEGARPQDLNRSRSGRIGAPSPETAAILERYHAAMRRELGRVLDGLAQPVSEEPEKRAKRWDLAIKLGCELGARDHREPEDPAPTQAARARAPRLTAAQR